MFDRVVRDEVGADGVGTDGVGAVGAVGCAGSLVCSARALAGVDVSALSDDGVVGVLARVEAARRALDAVCLDLVAEVDVRGVAVERSGHRTPAWLGVEFGWPAARARSEVRVARKLRVTLPEVAEALAEGRINADHVRVICGAANPRVQHVIAGAQPELIALAQGVRFERFRDEVMALADLADGDGGHDPRPEDNSLSVADGPSGELFLKGTLVGEWAATVRDALAPMTDRMFRRHRSDRGHCPELAAPTRSQLRAEALTELVRQGHAADSTATRAPVADVTLVMHTPGTAVHPAAELLGSRAGTCTTVSGIRYANRTVELLCCDAVFHTLVVDSLGVPLDLGTGVRFATRPPTPGGRCS